MGGYISEEQLQRFIEDDLPPESLEELMVVHRQRLPDADEIKKVLARPIGTHEAICEDRELDFSELAPPEMLRALHVPTYELLKFQEQSFSQLERKVQRLYRGSRANLQIILQSE